MKKGKYRKFKTVLIILILLLLGCCILGVVGEIHFNRYMKNIRKQQENINKQHIKNDDLPMTYIVMLDNSKSMKESFKNMNSQLIECLYVYQSILNKNDKLVIFPLNWELSDHIEISGNDKYEDGHERIKNIDLFTQETEELVEKWTQSVLQYMSQLEQTEIRVLVITDKTKNDLNTLEKIELENDNIRVITTELHVNVESDDDLSIRKIMDANEFLVTVFGQEFYMNYYGLYSYGFQIAKIADIRFPEKTNTFTILVTGKNASLSDMYIYPQKNNGVMEGEILSESICLYRYRSKDEIENACFFLRGSGIMYILYPTMNGKEITLEFNDDLLMETIIMLLILIVIIAIIYACAIFFEGKRKHNKKIFISYRRNGAAILAHAIAERMRSEHYSTYLDTESLKGDKFDTKLLNEIKESSCVIAVIPPGGLDGCLNSKDDWIRKELSWAIYNNIPIVPVLMNGFKWPDELPLDIVGLQFCNAIIFDEKNYYLESMGKVEEFVKYILDGEGIDDKEDSVMEKILYAVRLENTDKKQEK